MKTRFELLEKTYDKCIAEGFVKPKDKVDIPLITSLLTAAKEGILRLRKLSDIWEKESKNYAFILRENYEILRMLIDACLYTQKSRKSAF